MSAAIMWCPMPAKARAFLPSPHPMSKMSFGELLIERATSLSITEDAGDLSVAVISLFFFIKFKSLLGNSLEGRSLHLDLDEPFVIFKLDFDKF